MQVTRAVFEFIEPGEIFWTVRTRIQAVYNPMHAKLTFVCVKGKSGLDWAIFCSALDGLPADIARYGDKVHDREEIRSICPCDDEVFALYRQ